jgi:thiol-disulfide isomerase/thioredoxin
MPDKVINTQRYAQGLSYEDYLKQIGAENRAKFEEHFTGFKLAAADAKDFKDLVKKAGSLKAVVIGEDWCPDVQRGLPIMAKLAAASGMDLRFFPRDKNLDVMNLYLKEGKYQSIPVIAFLDKDYNPLCHFIERPAAAYKAMDELTAQLSKQKLSEEETRKLRREHSAPLADMFRQETVKELKAMLNAALKK